MKSYSLTYKRQRKDSKKKCEKINIFKCPVFVDVLCFLIVNYLTAYPAVYGQFPQAIPQPLAAVAPTQREGKNYVYLHLL